MNNTNNIFNIYCDESCHLPHDDIKPMLLGCIWSSKADASLLSERLKKLKESNRVAPNSELKWTKVSTGNLSFYLSLVDWFFSEPKLHFRVLTVPNKLVLDHAEFNNGSADLFYYKMYFWLLNKIVSPNARYRIYLDIKDTRSRKKVRKLREALCFDKYDFEGKMIDDIRCIRSHESQLLQLADFFIGAVGYKHRGLKTNAAKVAVIEQIEKNIGRSLDSQTSLFDSKFNMFVWTPRGKS